MTSGGEPSVTDEVLSEQVAWACRILAMGDHGDYTLGHVSARSADGRHVLMKRYGLGLEEVTPDDVLRIDLDGALLAGDGRVHLEYVVHTEIYRVRPDVASVIHTHPPYTTALGATDATLQLLNHDAVLFRDGLAQTRLRPLVSQGSYFQLVDYSAVSDLPEADFCLWLTREVGVAAIPLSVFYEAGFEQRLARLCFAKQDSTLVSALERLRRL